MCNRWLNEDNNFFWLISYSSMSMISIHWWLLISHRLPIHFLTDRLLIDYSSSIMQHKDYKDELPIIPKRTTLFSTNMLHISYASCYKYNKLEQFKTPPPSPHFNDGKNMARFGQFGIARIHHWFGGSGGEWVVSLFIRTKILTITSITKEAAYRRKLNGSNIRLHCTRGRTQEAKVKERINARGNTQERTCNRQRNAWRKQRLIHGERRKESTGNPNGKEWVNAWETPDRMQGERRREPTWKTQAGTL